jgi:hypothetical protein
VFDFHEEGRTAYFQRPSFHSTHARVLLSPPNRIDLIAEEGDGHTATDVSESARRGRSLLFFDRSQLRSQAMYTEEGGH